MKHPRWQRLIIGSRRTSGERDFAIVLLTAVFAVHHEIPLGLNDPAVVGWCVPGYPADLAGLKAGRQDRQIGDTRIRLAGFDNKILISPNQPLA